MKLFKNSSGFIFSFGFDMNERKEHSGRICWNDPTTGDWEASASNMAGYVDHQIVIDPEFIFERNGKVVAYQAGKCIELVFIDKPLIWSTNIYTPES